MNKTKFIVTMLLLVFYVVTVSAITPMWLKINGVTLDRFNDESIVPKSMNEKFLKGVFIGMTSELADKQLFVTKFTQTDKYLLAILRVDKNDYYVVTYKLKGGIIDGAFLFREGDIVMGCDYMNPGGNKMNSKSSTVSLEEGQVSVTRKFTTNVNAYQKGGPILIEDGSWTKIYAVDKSGKISVEANRFHSKWTERANMSVPGQRESKKETERDNCRSLGLGMNFLSLYTDPVNQETEESPKSFDNVLTQFQEMNKSSRSRNASDISDCYSYFVTHQKGLILRNPNVWLAWLDKNPESKSMEVLKPSLTDNDFKAELLKEVKSLKDKKLRKAWEKRLK